MIPKAFITAWRGNAPWRTNAQVEQDLVISRAIVELFKHKPLSDKLFFRGGTALYKLHLIPPARYSEDIDLVQINPEPIGETIDLIKSVIDPWLGKPKRQFSKGRVKLGYRFFSEDQLPVNYFVFFRPRFFQRVESQSDLLRLRGRIQAILRD